MQVLKQEKVDYIVAPYEADAQMTFLSVNKLVDAVITEDSDLIPFGCSRVSALLQPFFCHQLPESFFLSPWYHVWQLHDCLL
jgi:5'-3' exonuclease